MRIKFMSAKRSIAQLNQVFNQIKYNLDKLSKVNRTQFK
jgi:hypothetical protein